MTCPNCFNDLRDLSGVWGWPVCDLCGVILRDEPGGLRNALPSEIDRLPPTSFRVVLETSCRALARLTTKGSYKVKGWKMKRITYKDWLKKFEPVRDIDIDEPDELLFYDNGAVKAPNGDFIVKSDMVKERKA